MTPKNPAMASRRFLAMMLDDPYFPNPVVDRGVAVLHDLCGAIERTRPATDAALLALTHAATDRFNDLEEAFDDAGSEIETTARECIAEDFGAIAAAYGFGHIDVEDLIATRDW